MSDPTSRLSSVYSAEQTWTTAQRRVAIAVVATISGGLLIAPTATMRAVVAGVTALYLATMVARLRWFTRGLDRDGAILVADQEALAPATSALPSVTVLVPLYREAALLPALVDRLAALDYPAHRLQVRLLVEADDDETHAVAMTEAAARPDFHLDVVVVPPGTPRTKPRALNHGLIGATGEIITVYDAEDRPDPLQLRRVAVAFDRVGADVACLQAQLSYYNPDQNLITKWFTIEYLQWFGQLLPGIARGGSPVPLGGTSNHIRRVVLEAVGAWDAHNVTEDADLGVRLHREGHRVGVLASVTEEEANSDFVNWARQRSRWYKGYLQTWLVHMRAPRTLWRELGWRGFAGFNLFVGGTPLLVLVNPLFWTLTVVWWLDRPAFVQTLFPAWLYYPAMLAWVVGNASIVYTSLLTIRVARRPGLIGAALVSPLYWVMMSVAVIKAVMQLVTAPSFWEKTVHGLTWPTDVGDPATVVYDDARR